VTIRSLALALLACTLGIGAWAAEPGVDEPRANAPESAQPPAPVTAEPEPSTPREESGSDRFVPSEEITEDLSVSFPADI
jgi:hypothetical protein